MTLPAIINQLRWFADKAEIGGYGTADAIDTVALAEDLTNFLEELTAE
jgi:hypothetical protein